MSREPRALLVILCEVYSTCVALVTVCVCVCYRNKATKQHLKNVYSSLALTMLSAALGAVGFFLLNMQVGCVHVAVYITVNAAPDVLVCVSVTSPPPKEAGKEADVHVHYTPAIGIHVPSTGHYYHNMQ